MKSSAVLALATALAAGVAAGMGATLAAFSATAENGGNSFQAAASFCDGGGTQALTASADSYVDASLLAAGTNYGTATTLRVKSETLANQRALVRFSLPAPPRYCTLTAARLRLNATSATGGRTLQAVRVAGSWIETGVTWNNQPGTTGTAASTASGAGLIEFDVTSQVQAMYQGANNGFLLRDSVEGTLLAQPQVFSSREGANAPQLVVTFS